MVQIAPLASTAHSSTPRFPFCSAAAMKLSAPGWPLKFGPRHGVHPPPCCPAAHSIPPWSSAHSWRTPVFCPATATCLAANDCPLNDGPVHAVHAPPGLCWCVLQMAPVGSIPQSIAPSPPPAWLAPSEISSGDCVNGFTTGGGG